MRDLALWFFLFRIESYQSLTRISNGSSSPISSPAMILRTRFTVSSFSLSLPHTHTHILRAHARTHIHKYFSLRYCTTKGLTTSNRLACCLRARSHYIIFVNCFPLHHQLALLLIPEWILIVVTCLVRLVIEFMPRRGGLQQTNQ